MAFIDFQKAFDSVDRTILYEVLRKGGLKGKLYGAIVSIYSSVNACVRYNSEISECFPCPIGLRQGCKLSPILFALYINELQEFLENQDVRGIQLFPNIVEVFILMFADDIGLISDTISGLQRQLNALETFCDSKRLTVNTDKTKILVFKRGGLLSQREKWKYKNKQIECVNGFTYVGIFFTNRLSLYKMADAMAIKARKVLAQLFSYFADLTCLPIKKHFLKFLTQRSAPYYCTARSSGD